MSLHPQAQNLLALFAAVPVPDYGRLTAAALRQTTDGPSVFAPGDTVAGIENRSFAGPGGDLAIRIYRPQAQVRPEGALPVTLYFHGGGFVIGTLDTHDNICRCLAQRAGSLVVSVDYRRAPEAPFPAAVNDALAALNWLRAHAHEIGGDTSRIAVAGDSAGGNLAAVVAQQAAMGGFALRHQLLLYPVTDFGCDTASYRELGEGYYPTTKMMRWFQTQYLPDTRSIADPRASPLLSAPLPANCAAATVITAEYDPLRDEGEAYAVALEQAGVAVTKRRWPGQIHGFASMLGALDDADAVLSFAAGTLRCAFEAAPAARAA